MSRVNSEAAPPHLSALLTSLAKLPHYRQSVKKKGHLGSEFSSGARRRKHVSHCDRCTCTGERAARMERVGRAEGMLWCHLQHARGGSFPSLFVNSSLVYETRKAVLGMKTLNKGATLAAVEKWMSCTVGCLFVLGRREGSGRVLLARVRRLTCRQNLQMGWERGGRERVS